MMSSVRTWTCEIDGELCESLVQHWFTEKCILPVCIPKMFKVQCGNYWKSEEMLKVGYVCIYICVCVSDAITLMRPQLRRWSKRGYAVWRLVVGYHNAYMFYSFEFLFAQHNCLDILKLKCWTWKHWNQQEWKY